MEAGKWLKSLALSRWFNTYLEKHPDLDFLLNHQSQPLEQLNISDRYNFYLTQFSVEQSLRRLRQDHFALCMIRDLDFQASLFEITDSMTKFAEFAINIAYQKAYEELVERFGRARLKNGSEAQIHIVGMGKLGGGELNVSSDIDLVFLYPEDNIYETDGKKSISIPEFFIRLCRRIISILDDVSDEGRVFRVDTRLRPNGASGPLASSFNSFENYLFQEGRDWERYAWIKGRIIIGNLADDLEKIIRPFVFRKYLDFNAVTAMADLHKQIREQVERKDLKNNIKLGRGGIREIEFIAQLLQLMRGGRRIELQIKPTIKVLDELAATGFLKPNECNQLKQYYVFLRRLEHRLQYREDAQTQTIPENPQILANIINSLELSESDFTKYFNQLKTDVAKIFDNLFQESSTTTEQDNKLQIDEISNFWNNLNKIIIEGVDIAGMVNLPSENNPQFFLQKNGINIELLSNFINLAKSRQIRALKEEAAKDHLQILLFLLNFCKAEAFENPQQKQLKEILIIRFLDILAVLARRPSYLKFLNQTPSALLRLFRFLQASSWGSHYLQQHPILLDDLFDLRILDQDFSVADFRKQLNQGLKTEMDTGERMNWLREIHQSTVFRLLIQDLEGKLILEKLADNLSDIADVIIDSALKQCWQYHTQNSLEIKLDKPKLAVLAYGKLGGKELGYASDLDLVIIHDEINTSNYAYFHKTALSLTHWLSSNTELGVLFETDYRLRPDGDAGVMVPSLAGFAEYQKNKAWTWEHQAITRARFCAGDKKIGEKFESLRKEILSIPRDLEKLKKEIIKMREKISDNHKNKSSLFDIKHDNGGLVDIEFVVQYLVLAHSKNHPELTKNIGNIALLNKAGELDLIPENLAKNCANSYREYRRAQHQCRLNGQKYSRVDQGVLIEYQQNVVELWDLVFEN